MGLVRRWAATVTVCLGLFLTGIDATVLNIAIPDLQRDLRPSAAEVQWIIDGFALVMAGTVLAAGTLGDRQGRRRIFIAGLAVCTLASAGGGVADTPGQVIAARAGMGAGSALVMPATLSIIIHLFPEPHLRRRAITLWTAIAGIGGLLGPVVGGWLIEHFSWRAGFWINVPVAVLAIALAAWLVPESREKAAGSLDLLGVVLSTAGLSALVWAVVEGPGHGWTSPPVLAGFAVSVLLLAAFLTWQARCRSPMLPLHLLRVPRIAFGLSAMTLVSFIVFGLTLILTMYMQSVLGYTPMQTGIRLLPAPVGMIVGSGLALPLMHRANERLLVIAGTAVQAAALLMMATFTADTAYGTVALFLTILGVGAGLVMAPCTEMVMAAIPGRHAGLGSALNDVTRQVGLALGVAVQGSLHTSTSARRLRQRVGGLPDDVEAGTILATASSARGPGSPSPSTVTAAKDAFTFGMAQCAIACAVFLSVVIALAAWYARRTPATPNVPAPRQATSRRARLETTMKLLLPHTQRGVVLIRRLDKRGLWALALLPLLATPWLLRRRQRQTALSRRDRHLIALLQRLADKDGTSPRRPVSRARGWPEKARTSTATPSGRLSRQVRALVRGWGGDPVDRTSNHHRPLAERVMRWRKRRD
jgi:EmrB/QacA subfamily drug resistance transporter